MHVCKMVVHPFGPVHNPPIARSDTERVRHNHSLQTKQTMRFSRRHTFSSDARRFSPAVRHHDSSFAFVEIGANGAQSNSDGRQTVPMYFTTKHGPDHHPLLHLSCLCATLIRCFSILRSFFSFFTSTSVRSFVRSFVRWSPIHQIGEKPRSTRHERPLEQTTNQTTNQLWQRHHIIRLFASTTTTSSSSPTTH